MARHGDHGLTQYRVALLTPSGSHRQRLRDLLDDVPTARYAFYASAISELRGNRPPADAYLIDASVVADPADLDWLLDVIPPRAGILCWVFGNASVPPGIDGEETAAVAILSDGSGPEELATALEAVAQGLFLRDPRARTGGSAPAGPVAPAPAETAPAGTAPAGPAAGGPDSGRPCVSAASAGPAGHGGGADTTGRVSRADGRAGGRTDGRADEPGGAAPEIRLTRREHEVLELLAAGRPNEAIADTLGLSVNTVKFHLSSLYAKLDVGNRTQAVREGARRGLLLL